MNSDERGRGLAAEEAGADEKEEDAGISREADEKDPVLSDMSVEEWIENQSFRTTKDIEIPERMSDRVIGQDRAVDVMKKAAAQKRHMMLIGEPGTGKSMLANSMTEYLPQGELQDIVAYANPEDENEPRIRVFPAGKGKQVVAQQKAQAAAQKSQKSSSYMYACTGIVILGLFGALLFQNYYILFISLFAIMIILLFARNPMMVQRNDNSMVPKLLVGHESGDKPPFVDATGTHSGALLGDVRHDPYQSGGLETPAHNRIEAGDIHRANKGVLYIDEINLLKLESQQALLTAMQEKKMAVTGQSEKSSGALVKSEPVPCDFVLVCAGNLDAMKGIHPALRSRIRGYGYEIYMRNTMPDTEQHRTDVARFVAQEVRKDEKIPHFDKYAVGEIIKEAQRRAGRRGRLTLRFRELGGLIRVAGDLAVAKSAGVVTRDDVIASRLNARSLEQQIADRQIEASKAYQLFNVTGEKVGQINGLAALDPGTGMAEYSGIMLPIVAEVTPAHAKNGGKIIATGKLGEIAKEAVDNISAVIKKYANEDLSEMDIHLEYIGTYEGVEGDSASITMAAVILSAITNVPIRQDLAMTGSLNVRGRVMPVGAVTAKLEAAAIADIRIALIPEDNGRDVMIRNKFYETMDVYTVATFRDVIEYAFVDCKKKKELMKRLLPLNEDGKSSAKKLEPPKEHEYTAEELSAESQFSQDPPRPPAPEGRGPEPEPPPAGNPAPVP